MGKKISAGLELSAPLLPYCGIDFVLAPDGRWRIIEVNDHPVALINALSLCEEYRFAFFDGNPFGEIAKILMAHAQGKPIALLLPECFRIVQSRKRAKHIQLLPGQDSWDDTRISATLLDFNKLADALTRLGGESVICDVTQVTENGSDVTLQDGRVIRALFRRASEFPRGNVDCFCVNPKEQRLLCGDKLETHRAMSVGGISGKNLIPTFPYAYEVESIDFLKCAASKDQWVIVKPRYGGASIGVKRQRARQTLEDILTEISERELPDLADRIIQPWVPSALTKSEKGAHHFDIRLFLVDGAPVAGFARRSAAAVGSVASDTPLEWLTTTGKTLPLVLGRERPNVVRLFPHDIEALKNISLCAVKSLSDAAREILQGNDVVSFPSFTQMANVSDAVEFILVQ